MKTNSKDISDGLRRILGGDLYAELYDMFHTVKPPIIIKPPNEKGSPKGASSL